MTKIFQILLLMILNTALYSQTETPNLKNDIGLNVNAILNKIIFNKINDEITNPFPDQVSILTYRHFVSSKIAIRLGLGFDQFNRYDSTFSIFSGPSIEEDKFRFFAMHFGIQKNIVDAKKVKLTLGWDWFFRRELQERIRNDLFIGGGINFQEIISTDLYKENSFGFGIPIGIQYFFNDHILISTEFSLEIFKTFSKNKSEFNGSRNDEYRDNPDVVNINFQPPLAMFIHYRF